MCSGRRLAAIVLLSFMALAEATAASLEWRRYAIPATGLSVDVPISIFEEDRGATEEGALERHLFTKDYRANLTIKSFPNPDNVSPAAFLEKMRPPADIQYRRVTPKFFAVSGVRDGYTWYNRCNRATRFMNCVLINYPAAEERQWDATVTRISLSLAK
ncbi:hypothetical protein CP49_15320 [Bradyrhizobium valentinum]|uniref:Uncharacterized protein n=1 Tax=Bradyrhizobium valentinum TaxID=1518501 RepID=A0A0R3LDN5_9BRAD|nr:hypothetical protein CP49_15320 [Bradyrhizobium valentinum]